MFNPKVFVAEFIGTFALVFIGAAAGIYGQNVGLLGIALAHGLTLAVFMYVFGHISGAHINPAVTLGLALNGTIKWVETIVYWAAQFSGAVFAAFLLRMFLTPLSADAFSGAATSGLLGVDHAYYAMGLEALLTFFLVNTFLHTAVGGKAGPFAGWAIGATLAIAIMVGGPLTGASLNPARSFGPAIFTSALEAGRLDYQNPMLYLIYFVGPFMGSLMAVGLYQFFTYEPVTMEDIESEEEDEEEEKDVEVVVEPVKKPATRKPAARKTTAKKTAK
ncbi:MAG: aquaporin [Anaerolineales bacterium]|nr:aquaporin [Anaerolineae bacterium]PWB68960.1 MAG: aquaporin [Anaerolineales bacterium]